MDLLPNLLNLRSISDPILISQDFKIYIIALGVLGLGLGLIIARKIWFRSAERIKQIETETTTSRAS